MLVWVAARFSPHFQSGDLHASMRDVGLLLISFNLIMQALKPNWPLAAAVPLASVGMALWVYGWLGSNA